MANKDTPLDVGVSPVDLMAQLSANPDRVLLLDVRPYSEYCLGHIKSALSVRLSSILLRRLGMNKARLESVLSDEHKAKFRAIMEQEPIMTVVYDSQGSKLDPDDIDKKNPLHVVFHNLKQNDHHPQYLIGGYEAVSQVYDLCISVDASRGESKSHPFSLGSLGLSLSLAAPDSLTPSTPIERHVRDKAPSEILPYLYVGAEGHAQDRALLDKLGIGYILNLTTRGAKKHEGIVQHTIPIRDCWNQNLADHFDDAFSFICRARDAKSKILVHCVAGISRSPTVAIAYIMKELNKTLQEAYSMVKDKRPSVAPNLDFMGELQQYERKLYETRDGKPSGWDGLHDSGIHEAPLIETK
eukprot:TRINITY_DN4296_c0_g1_i2.p1 TRINITY_DN4296_c0_g1~~TRINITY_DN4296_c0_g1_i2.p1  ORF type:complete len:355 (+),score=35.84 TRINITY_DN4296_c0_g1_i2:208-1272(+)